MTTREKLIEATKAELERQMDAYEWHGRDFEIDTYPLSVAKVIDAILAELREPDEGLTAALVAAVRQQVAWVSPDPTSQNPASEVLFVDAGSIDVDEIKVAMIDHIRSGK